jgi:hypothetical protein
MMPPNPYGSHPIMGGGYGGGQPMPQLFPPHGQQHPYYHHGQPQMMPPPQQQQMQPPQQQMHPQQQHVMPPQQMQQQQQQMPPMQQQPPQQQLDPMAATRQYWRSLPQAASSRRELSGSFPHEPEISENRLEHPPASVPEPAPAPAPAPAVRTQPPGSDTYEIDKGRALVKLSAPGNSVKFTIAEVVLNLRIVLGEWKISEDEVFNATATSQSGPFVAAVSVKGAAALVEEKTVTIIKSQSQEEADFTVTLLDENGRTAASNARYKEVQDNRRASGTRRVEGQTVRFFIDYPETYLMYTAESYDRACLNVQERTTSLFTTLGGTSVNYTLARTKEMELPLNSTAGFAVFTEDTDLDSLVWHTVKYVDDGHSKSLITIRIARSHIDEMRLAACCFRLKTICGDERERLGTCQARTRWYDLRRSAHASASRGAGSAGALAYKERKEEKERVAVGNKRLREENEQKTYANLRDRACSKWKKGTCNKVTTRNGFVPARACGHRHSFTPGVKELLADYLTIPCALGSEGTECPLGPDECPYDHVPPPPPDDAPMGERAGEPDAATAAAPAASSGEQAAVPAAPAEPPTAPPESATPPAAPPTTRARAAASAPTEPEPDGTHASGPTTAAAGALDRLHTAAR